MRIQLSTTTLNRLTREAAARGLTVHELADQLLRKALSQLKTSNGTTHAWLPNFGSSQPGNGTEKPRNPEEVLSVTQVAEALHVTRRTVYSMVHRKDLPPPLHIGKYACWKWGDVQAYLEKSLQQRGLRRRRKRSKNSE